MNRTTPQAGPAAPKRATLRVKREPLPALLAAQLSAAIFRGDIPTGARLTEEAVAAEAQVSKSTVREALRLLARDGLVKLVPMSGARVTTLEQQDVREISELRIALETFAARAAAAAPDAAVQDAARALEMFAAAIRAKRWVDIIDADIRFHRSIITATGNTRLRQFWDQLEPQIRLYLGYRAEEAYDLTTTIRNHEALLAAVRSGDPDRAAEAFRAEIARRTGVRLALWRAASAP